MKVSRRRSEAARWLARLQADDVSDRDRAACEAWLAADPANRQALAQVTMVWDVAGGLAVRPDPAPQRPASRLPRRAVLASAAAAGGALLWAAAAPVSYATTRGEIRTVRLKDGTRVVLDTASRVTVSPSFGSRRLELVTGRALITVASDIQHPFLIANGAQQILAMGGALQVSRREGDVSTLSLDGPVFVKQGGAATLRLEGGQRLSAGMSRPTAVERGALEAASAWQSGRLIFDNEPLAAAVQEVNRYSAEPLVLTDPAVERLRISGAYHARDTAAFARSVATLFGLRLLEQPGRTVLTSA